MCRTYCTVYDIYITRNVYVYIHSGLQHWKHVDLRHINEMCNYIFKEYILEIQIHVFTMWRNNRKHWSRIIFIPRSLHFCYFSDFCKFATYHMQREI
jgi:hypothetical protein